MNLTSEQIQFKCYIKEFEQNIFYTLKFDGKMIQD